MPPLIGNLCCGDTGLSAKVTTAARWACSEQKHKGRETKRWPRSVRLALTGKRAAGFIGCVVLILLSFAAAYGFVAAGIPPWAGFLIVSGAYVLVAGLALLIGVFKIRRMTGLRRTRASVHDSLALLLPDANAEGSPEGAS